LIHEQFYYAIVLCSGLVSAQASAECAYPTAPGAFPDGTKATKEELIAARKIFVQYDGEMTTYIECIVAEYQAELAAKPDLTPKQKKELARVNDEKQTSAIAEIEAVKVRFEKERKAYVELHPPAPKPAN
jgi:hypothetical protein